MDLAGGRIAMKLSGSQKRVIFMGLLLLAINIIYVPYKGPYGDSLGYGLIFNPISYSTSDGKRYLSEGLAKELEKMIRAKQKGSRLPDAKPGLIDYERIALQSGAIVLLTVALFYTHRDKGSHH